MESKSKAYVGARIFDGTRLHVDQALLFTGRDAPEVMGTEHLPEGADILNLNGGTITPGFVDLQVNGGGGVMFNDAPCAETLAQIASAHAKTGTVGFLPTLITDTPVQTKAAINAVCEAIGDRVAGILGIHLEGPHLAAAKKGAHDAGLIRLMQEDDLRLLLSAAERIPNVMVTVAPEAVSTDQIRLMADAGIVVSLGHTAADFETCLAAFDAGARCVTHLFNAMSQLNSRAPGLVGAALARSDVYAGLIADGIHVAPGAVRAALAARSERTFLVTDAMAVAGTGLDRFTLNGREVLRVEGHLTLADGTLAGADLTMARAISVMTGLCGDDMATALARAATTPLELLREKGTLGRLAGGPADLLYLSDDLADPTFLDC